MALVIEDGTVVDGANSYIDVDAAKAFAEARGVDLGTDDTLIERQLIIAMDYLESLGYKGSRVDVDTPQPLSWPRYGVSYDGVTYPWDEIPVNLQHAQAQLVIEQKNGVVFWSSTSAATGTEKFIKREKVDVLETEYATPKEMGDAGFAETALMPAVDALLKPLLRTFRFGPIPTYRV